MLRNPNTSDSVQLRVWWADPPAASARYSIVENDATVRHPCAIGVVRAAQPEPFTFAGLNLKTTMADLEKRYPSSIALGTFVHLSDEESHDHISTIGLSSNGAARTTPSPLSDGAGQSLVPIVRTIAIAPEETIWESGSYHGRSGGASAQSPIGVEYSYRVADHQLFPNASTGAVRRASKR